MLYILTLAMWLIIFGTFLPFLCKTLWISPVVFMFFKMSVLFQEFIERLHDLHEEWLLGPESASVPAPVCVSIAGFI